MKYDFETLKSRKGMDAGKWEVLEVGKFKDTDYIPFSVADMDIVSPPELIDAMVKRAEFGMYGYTPATEKFFEAIQYWMKKRHGWKIENEWIFPLCGVVNGIYEAVKAFSEVGDEVIIQPPVYFPFRAAVEDTRRTVVENNLIIHEGKYVIDYEDLEKKAENAKLLILCSPHNPVGRVWQYDELMKLSQICYENDVKIIVDEIHGDLVYEPNQFTAYGTLKDEFVKNSIICTSAGKTFSIPGLNTASIIIPDKALRQAFQKQAYEDGLHYQNTFGTLATIVAYTECEDWVDELCAHLYGNFLAFKEFMAEKFPKVTVFDLEGTYLAWFDCRSFGLSAKELERFMIDDCGIYLNEGYKFGKEGEGFERINLACPRNPLINALDRMYAKAKQRGIVY